MQSAWTGFAATATRLAHLRHGVGAGLRRRAETTTYPHLTSRQIWSDPPEVLDLV